VRQDLEPLCTNRELEQGASTTCKGRSEVYIDAAELFAEKSHRMIASWISESDVSLSSFRYDIPLPHLNHPPNSLLQFCFTAFDLLVRNFLSRQWGRHEAARKAHNGAEFRNSRELC
jgi:hypothetical protein